MQSANSNNNPYVLSPPINSASNSPLASPAITPPSRAAGSPPTRNATNATDSTYYTTEEGYSDDTTPDISAFTIINPSSAAGQASSTPNIPTSPPPQYHQVQQQQQPSADTYQPLPRARTTSNSSIQLYIPYSQNAPTVSPLARLSTSTLIPLQVQRTQSPENPTTGVSSLQGSLHSNSTDSNGSGVRDRVRNRHMSAPLMATQPPPTIILETPSPCVGDDEGEGATEQLQQQQGREASGSNSSSDGEDNGNTTTTNPKRLSPPTSPSSSSGTLAGHRQSALTALTAAAASAGMPSTSTASGAGRRARSASGSSLPRYYSPQASFDDVALRTVEDVGSDGEAESEAAAARAGRPRTAEVTPLFGTLGGKRPRLSSIVRRSYGP